MPSALPPANGLARVAAALLLASVAVALLGPSVENALRYDREAVLAGQAWRLLSAHVVHLGWAHLALNAGALGVLAALAGDLHPASRWSLLSLLSALSVGVGLLLASPAVAWYVGLSGLTHGLAAAAAWTLVRRRAAAGWAGLALLAAKLAWEQGVGAVPGSSGFIGGHTIVDAHLYGALGGALGALLPPARRPAPRS